MRETLTVSWWKKQMMERSHEWRVSFPLTKRAPSSARRWLAAKSELRIDLRDRVELLLSELVANSVVHSGLVSPDRVDISVRDIPGGLHVEVTDQGVGIDDPATQEPAHFGLRLVDSLTDRWGYTNEPTRVWFDISGNGALSG
jgi:anti-sigma regulatory factor (Ser/Thr protein kinase)